jgi:tRNA G26 N,N-dimethylase Trm1
MDRALEDVRGRKFKEASRIFALLRRVDDFPPWSFSTEQICSSLGVPSVPDDKVVEALKDAGFESSRQPFEKTGLKTDAGYADVIRAVALVSESRGNEVEETKFRNLR